MSSSQLLDVIFVVSFDPLSHKVGGDRILNLSRVIFFGRYPASHLIDFLSGDFAISHFVDLSLRFGNRVLIFQHLFKTQLITIDATRHLAVSHRKRSESTSKSN